MTNDATATMTHGDADTGQPPAGAAEAGQAPAGAVDIGRALELLMRSLQVDRQQAFDFIFDASQLGGCEPAELARTIVDGVSVAATP
jgi:hypothetical protein